MMRALVIVSLLLVLSIGINVIQYGRASAEAGREEVRTVLDRELGRVQGIAQALQESVDRTATVADYARADNAALLSDLYGIADRSRTRVTVYRDRVAAAPTLTCPPGIERMDAINGILGGAP